MEIGALELQRISASGWRAENFEERYPWLLRANAGFTKRANSALPLSDDSDELIEALPAVFEFYEGQNLPTRIQVPLPTCRRLGEALSEHGFSVESPTRFLTARIEDVIGDSEETGVEISSRVSEEWLEACDLFARPLGGSGRALISRHPRAGFSSVRDASGDLTAVGRVVVDGEWAALSTAAVRSDFRRRGLATAMIRSRLRWAAREYGARYAYLQVESDNSASLTMCDKVGFKLHHTYQYRVVTNRL